MANKPTKTERQLETALVQLELAVNAVKQAEAKRDRLKRRVDELMEKNSQEHLTESRRKWNSDSLLSGK